MTKKCLLINRIPLGEEGRLRRKHYEQMEAFQNLGYDTYSVGYDDGKCYLIHKGEKEYVCDAPLHGYGSYVGMYKVCRFACKQVGGFDIAYVRRVPGHFAHIKFLKDIRPFCKKIIYDAPRDRGPIPRRQK